ncbi:hypothetical protein ACHAWU_003553 [Discostella pseudostelligera]|uniref:Uncharacterized protein n=1 Tax=Discostella pseudostelligera TaxID=259834 RepID=A0ABD3N4S5_9STRA
MLIISAFREGSSSSSSSRSSSSVRRMTSRSHPSPLLDAISYAQASDVRAQNGHYAAMHYYRQLLLHNPQDTSAATRIAAADNSMNILSRVGWSYTQLMEAEHQMTQSEGHDWEDDIDKLNSILDMSNYRHYSLREHVFNLPTGIVNNNDDEDDSPLGMYKTDYPMGPTYARPLYAGECFDVSQSIGAFDSDTGWLRSLQCLTALFLLSSCVPRKIFLDSIIGGGETLELMLRLGIVFVFNDKKQLSDAVIKEAKLDEEWVVPLVHLFPLEIPPILRSQTSGAQLSTDMKGRKNIVIMTDLHPNVLGMTSIDRIEKFHQGNDACCDGNKGASNRSEGAVMYIGPDSLALIQHLHASLLQFIENSDEPQSFRRVLDVCTGSGVQALAALTMLDSLNDTAEKSSVSVAVAVDINERALRFTTFNAHLNGYKDQILTVHADVLSETVNRQSNEGIDTEGIFTGANASLVTILLEKLTEYERHYAAKNEQRNEEQKFDLFLANPPFIPVPPSRSDCVVLPDEDGNASPRYGLFSSGGASGEDCLCAIVRMAPPLLKSDGGLLAVVSEFMNPPPLSYSSTNVDDAKPELISRIEKWWGQQSIDGSVASGILFTNENAIKSGIYAERRAVRNDMEDINVWKQHLSTTGIHSISPGLLFVQLKRSSNKNTAGKEFTVRHHHVPKTKHGSIWTPHNFEAVNYTRGKLMDWFR